MDQKEIKNFFKQNNLSLPEFLKFCEITRAQFENHMKTITNNKATFTVEQHKKWYRDKVKSFIELKINQLKNISI